MTERILCKSEGCSATILPSTVAKTGGICMPCFQELERKKRRAYIERHRKEVNLYEGLTNRVDILKVMHAPRKHDPLIKYIRYPLSKEQIYTLLSKEEAHGMQKYAMELLAAHNESEAEEILLSLVCYRNGNVSDALPILIQQGLFYNSILFKDAQQDIQNHILERVMWDDDNRNHLLLALGWIGNAVVIEQFREWQMQPPKWGNQLHVTPETYALDGGWELTADGKRRDLNSQLCYAIRKTEYQENNLNEKQDAHFIKSSDSICPWCQRKLTKLIDVATSHPSLRYLDLKMDNLQVMTCDLCGGYSPIYMELINDGMPIWSRYNEQTNYFRNMEDVNGELDQSPHIILSHEPQSPYYAAVWANTQLNSQIGGYPGWVQEPEYPVCPCCGQRMRFIGQIDYAEFEEFAEGIFYMFLCSTDSMTATVYQQS